MTKKPLSEYLNHALFTSTLMSLKLGALLPPFDEREMLHTAVHEHCINYSVKVKVLKKVLKVLKMCDIYICQ